VRGRRFENAIEPSERWQIARARASEREPMTQERIIFIAAYLFGLREEAERESRWSPRMKRSNSRASSSRRMIEWGQRDRRRSLLGEASSRELIFSARDFVSKRERTLRSKDDRPRTTSRRAC